MLQAEKIINIASAFLSHAPDKKMAYIKLIKLMYILDRKYIQKTGVAPSTDDHVSMKNGPVLSATYSYIKDNKSYWSQFIKTTGYDVQLIKEPKNTLNPELLSDIRIAYWQSAHMTWEEIIDFTHDYFEEWDEKAEIFDTSYPIKIEDIRNAKTIEQAMFANFSVSQDIIDFTDSL